MQAAESGHERHDQLFVHRQAAACLRTDAIAADPAVFAFAFERGERFHAVCAGDELRGGRGIPGALAVSLRSEERGLPVARTGES